MSNRKVCQIVITAEEKEQSGGKVVQLSNGVARKPSLGRWLLCKGLKKVRETSVQVSGWGGGGKQSWRRKARWGAPAVCARHV